MVGEGSICTSAAASSRADVARAADAIFGKREKLGRAESLFRRRKNRGERRREATRQEIGITKAFFENIALMRPIWGETRFRGWCDSIDCCRRVVSMRIRWGDRVACYLGFYVCRDWNDRWYWNRTKSFVRLKLGCIDMFVSLTTIEQLIRRLKFISIFSFYLHTCKF